VTEDAPDAARDMLAAIVQRNLAEGKIAGDPVLLAEGWERRFVADGARVEELTRLYEDLGYEVRTQRIRPEQIGGSCEGCRAAILAGFQMIYTRRRP
jgi:hypothetical protein